MTHASNSKADTKSLFAAIADDNAAAVATLLKGGVDVEQLDSRGLAALHAAAAGAGPKTIQELLSGGARINRRLPKRPLGSTGIQRRAVRQEGTALNTAIRTPRLGIASFLLDKGADPRVTDETGQTALHHLVLSIHEHAVLSQEAEIAVKVVDKHRNEAHTLIKRVLEQVPIDQMDEFGQTALRIAIDCGCHPDTVGLLMKEGANPNTWNSNGIGAIHGPWSISTLAQLHALVTAGADINARDRHGNTALAHADDSEAVSALIALGCDLKHVNNLGQTALHFRVQNDLAEDKAPIDAVVALLDRGVNPDAPDYSGESAAEIVLCSGKDEAEQIALVFASHRANATLKSAARKSVRKA